MSNSVASGCRLLHAECPQRVHSKAWLFRFKWDGTPTRITLGKFPAVGLAEARQLALKNREWLDKGIDPRRAADRLGKRNSDDRTAAPAKGGATVPGREPSDPSDFEERLAATPKDRIPQPDPDDRSSVLFIAHEYIEKWFKSQGKDSKEACRMLRADVLPKWHWRDGRTITSREVIELLDTVVERGAPALANNLAQMLGHMFKFAIHRGTLENSPVQLLYRPGGKPRRRKRVLSEEELRSFVTNIDSIISRLQLVDAPEAARRRFGTRLPVTLGASLTNREFIDRARVMLFAVAHQPTSHLPRLLARPSLDSSVADRGKVFRSRRLSRSRR